MTAQLRHALARSLAVCGMTALARRRQRRRLRILMYHGVLPRVHGPAALGNLFISVASFARQLRHLKRAYHIVSLEEVMEAIDRGGVVPDRAVAITFDDGYRTTMNSVQPILEALGVPATVFVPTDCAGQREFLWFDALRVLLLSCVEKKKVIDLGEGVVIDERMKVNPAQAFQSLSQQIMGLPQTAFRALVCRLTTNCQEQGLFDRYPEFALAEWKAWRRAVEGGLISIGSHGRAHEDLVRMSPEERLADLRESQRDIERELGRPCYALAYPYGAWNDEVARTASLLGYRYAVTVDDGLNGPQANRFGLFRTAVGDGGEFHLFRARVSGLWGGLRSFAKFGRTPQREDVNVHSERGTSVSERLEVVGRS